MALTLVPMSSQLWRDNFPKMQPRLELVEDAHLMSGVTAGDQDAILRLYDLYSPVAFATLRRVLHDEGLAEELTQDIFMQLWLNPGSYNPLRGSLRAWIAVISRYRAIDHLRKHRREQIGLEDDSARFAAPQFNNAAVGEIWGKVNSQLSRMPAEERDLFELAYFQGFTHTEISFRTGLPLGTVKSRLRSAIGRLRVLLEDKT